jgi:hypothetical protein
MGRKGPDHGRVILLSLKDSTHPFPDFLMPDKVKVCPWLGFCWAEAPNPDKTTSARTSNEIFFMIFWV